MKSRAVKTGCWFLLSLLPLLGLTTGAEARAPGPGYDVIAPPPPPPPEIRRMPGPPPEIRQTQPPDELRKVAPPPEVSTPSKDPAKTGALPELAVVTVGVSNSTPKVGERVTITARLRNSGTDTVKGVKVRFFAADRQVGERGIDLPPGNSDAGVAFIPDSSGALQVKVTLDRGFTAATRILKVQGEGRELAKAKTDPEPRPGSGESDKGTLPPQRIPFEKPEQVMKGTKLPGKEGGPGGPGGPSGPRPGSPPGYGPPGLQDPTGGLGDKKKPKGVPGTTPWGGSGGMGKPDLGDGIEGIHDQGDMPKTDLGKDIPDPRKGPGQKTTGHGWGKGQYGEPMFKTGGERYDPCVDAANSVRGISGVTKVFAGYAEGGNKWKVVGVIGEFAIVVSGEKGKENKVSVTSKEEAALVHNVDIEGPEGNPFMRFIGAERPREDGKGKVTDSPKIIFTDPHLVMNWIKAGPTEGPRGDPQVSDPVPVKGGKAASGPEGGVSPAKGGELAAAGAVKATAKWRFSGRKPGSGVTDPAEWQDSKIRDFSFARMKHFEVIDPVEAPGLKNVLSKAQAGAAAGAGAPSVTITSVGGAVQKLAVQDGKQGWAPLKAGDRIGPGAVVRIDTGVGGEVGVGKDINQALQQSWTKVYSSQSHAVYLLQQNK